MTDASYPNNGIKSVVSDTTHAVVDPKSAFLVGISDMSSLVSENAHPGLVT
jgi:hypothetical protein